MHLLCCAILTKNLIFYNKNSQASTDENPDETKKKSSKVPTEEKPNEAKKKSLKAPTEAKPDEAKKKSPKALTEEKSSEVKKKSGEVKKKSSKAPTEEKSGEVKKKSCKASTEEKCDKANKKSSIVPTEEKSDEAKNKSSKALTERKPDEAKTKSVQAPTEEKHEKGTNKNDQAAKKSSEPPPAAASENTALSGSKQNSRRSSYASSTGDGATTEGSMSKEKLLVGKISFDEKKSDAVGTEQTANNEIKEIPVESPSMKSLPTKPSTLKRGPLECKIDFKEISKKFMEVVNEKDTSNKPSTTSQSATAPDDDVKPINEELIILCVKKNLDSKSYTIVKDWKTGSLPSSVRSNITLTKPVKKLTAELMGDPECIDLEPDSPPKSLSESSTVPSSSALVPSSSTLVPTSSTPVLTSLIPVLTMETPVPSPSVSVPSTSAPDQSSSESVPSASAPVPSSSVSVPSTTPVPSLSTSVPSSRATGPISSAPGSSSLIDELPKSLSKFMESKLLHIVKSSLATADRQNSDKAVNSVQNDKPCKTLASEKVKNGQTLIKSASKIFADKSTEKTSLEIELKKQEAAADDSISKLLSEIPSLVVNKILICNVEDPPIQEIEKTTTTKKADKQLPKSRSSSLEDAPKKMKKQESKEKAAFTKAALKRKEEKIAKRLKASRKDSSDSAEVPEKRVLRSRPKKKPGRKKGAGIRETRSSVSQSKNTPKRERKIPTRFLVFDEVGGKRQRASSESGKEDLTDSNKKVQVKAKKQKTTEEPTGKKFKSAVTEALSAAVSKNNKEDSSKEKKSSKVLSAKQKQAAAVLLDKVQAEYAVSALYNYRHSEDEQKPLEPEPDDDVPLIKLKLKLKPTEVKKVGRKRKHLKQILKKGTRMWSQDKLNFYQNRRKRGKTVGTFAERELMRLGHVIINMDNKPSASAVKEAEDTSSTCSKDFCKLGCVCNSLEVPMREEFHCGKAECIFQCICVKAGASNCLFDCRVQDKTRNLAPEQKEFTNTVISTGAENLVVAERGKRERKVPQRLQVRIFSCILKIRDR